jgi:hypothetical protein
MHGSCKITLWQVIEIHFKKQAHRHILYKTITVFECIVSFFENGNLNVNVIVYIVVTVYCGKYEELDKFYFEAGI